VGSIAVKAGMVLRASAGQLSGHAAVAQLIQSPPTCRFVMSRMTTPVGDVEPIGSLDRVLQAPTAPAPARAEAGPKPTAVPRGSHPFAWVVVPVVAAILAAAFI